MPVGAAVCEIEGYIMKKIAIVLAGGSGSRMKSQLPKQYMKIENRPLLYYSLKAFEDSCVDEIILVTADTVIDGMGEQEYCKKNIIDKYNIKKCKRMVYGGKERYNSVYNALQLIGEELHEKKATLSEADENVLKCEKNHDSPEILISGQGGAENAGMPRAAENADLPQFNENADLPQFDENSLNEDIIVFIHDGARPCVDDEIIENCMNGAMEFGASVAAVMVKDTIKIADENRFAKCTPDRNMLWQVQTPQTFKYSIVKKAYDNMISDNNKSGITDDAMVVERYSAIKVKLVESKYENIKVTTPEDMEIVTRFLKKSAK